MPWIEVRIHVQVFIWSVLTFCQTQLLSRSDLWTNRVSFCLNLFSQKITKSLNRLYRLLYQVALLYMVNIWFLESHRTVRTDVWNSRLKLYIKSLLKVWERT